MQRIFIFAAVLAGAVGAGCSLPFPAARGAREQGNITVFYWDAATAGKAGPRFTTKERVYIDGDLAAESEPDDRYARKVVRISVPPGTHFIVVQGVALKNGKWVERTRESGESSNHTFSREITIRPGEKKTLNFVVPDLAKSMKIKL